MVIFTDSIMNLGKVNPDKQRGPSLHPKPEIETYIESLGYKLAELVVIDGGTSINILAQIKKWMNKHEPGGRECPEDKKHNTICLVFLTGNAAFKKSRSRRNWMIVDEISDQEPQGQALVDNILHRHFDDHAFVGFVGWGDAACWNLTNVYNAESYESLIR